MAAGEMGLCDCAPPASLTLPFSHGSVSPSLSLCLLLYRCVFLSQWAWPPSSSVSLLLRPSLSFPWTPQSVLCRDLKKNGVVSHRYFCLQPYSPGAGQGSLGVPDTWIIHPIPSQPPPPGLSSLFSSPQNLPGRGGEVSSSRVVRE